MIWNELIWSKHVLSRVSLHITYNDILLKLHRQVVIWDSLTHILFYLLHTLKLCVSQLKMVSNNMTHVKANSCFLHPCGCEGLCDVSPTKVHGSKKHFWSKQHCICKFGNISLCQVVCMVAWHSTQNIASASNWDSAATANDSDLQHISTGSFQNAFLLTCSILGIFLFPWTTAREADPWCICED